MANPATRPSSEDVRIEEIDSALWIRLNRPDRMNAFDPQMCAAITEAIHEAAPYRSVVITGVGRAFCAGGSLGTLATRPSARCAGSTAARCNCSTRSAPAPGRLWRPSTVPLPAAGTSWWSPAISR